MAHASKRAVCVCCARTGHNRPSLSLSDAAGSGGASLEGQYALHSLYCSSANPAWWQARGPGMPARGPTLIDALTRGDGHGRSVRLMSEQVGGVGGVMTGIGSESSCGWGTACSLPSTHATKATLDGVLAWACKAPITRDFSIWPAHHGMCSPCPLSRDCHCREHRSRAAILTPPPPSASHHPAGSAGAEAGATAPCRQGGRAGTRAHMQHVTCLALPG